MITREDAARAAFTNPSVYAEEVYTANLLILNRMHEMMVEIEASSLVALVAEDLDSPFSAIEDGVLSLMGALKSAAFEAGYELK